MFKLFRKKSSTGAVNPLQEKVAASIVTKVLWLQSKWALYMDHKINRLSNRSKKFGLTIFVGLSVLICVSILVETFRGPHQKASFQIGNIRKSKHTSSTGEAQVSSSLPKNQYRKIVAFLHYMDSLSGSVSGRKVFDSINGCRPGLLDSAITLEKLYHAQNK
jgi:hypothetical protein